MNKYPKDKNTAGSRRIFKFAGAAVLAVMLAAGGFAAYHVYQQRSQASTGAGGGAQPGKSKAGGGTSGASSAGGSSGAGAGGSTAGGSKGSDAGESANSGSGNPPASNGGSTGGAPGTEAGGNPSGTGGSRTSDSNAAAGLSMQWPQFGNNAQMNRCSPDQQLTPDTAASLTRMYNVTLPDSAGGNESFPLMSKGVLYVTTNHASILAIDAVSGKIKWTFTPKTHVLKWIPKINRGVAMDERRLYVLTPDNQLIAVRKSDGKQVYAVTVADQNAGYFESMAPMVADGKVIVGSSGGDEGIRGFIAAYDADSGKQLWRFYTVPKRGTGWMPQEGYHGGGAVWTTPAYDAETGRIYAGTGNPSPDYYGQARKGPDPYTDSVIGLNIRTGKLEWVQQEVPHDLWDYDVASPPIVFQIGGRKVIGEAGKDGFWHEWDVKTGKPLWDPVAFVNQDHTPPTPQGVLEWPGPAGGANYGPSAYDPAAGRVFVAGINGPEVLKSGQKEHGEGEVDLGTGQTPAPVGKWSGTITAIDAENGKVDWQFKTSAPPIGGVTVNLGGVVLFGETNAAGTMHALSAATGKSLWTKEAGAPIGSAPIVYQWKGRTFVTFVSGGAKSMTGLYPYSGPAHVLTFKVRVNP